MDRALLALCALVLNAALGGPKRLYDALGTERITLLPVKVLRDVERRLNREQRSLMERETRGFILVLVVVGGCFMAASILRLLFGSAFHFVELVILACALPVRPTFDTAFGIRKYLQANNLAAARMMLDGTVWRHHAMMDEQGLARAAIEIIAVRFTENIVSPVFWFLILGLPGVFVPLAINMMRDRMAPTQEVELGFGHATWGLHKWMHYIPSRIAAVLWALVSLFLPANKWQDISQAFFVAAKSLKPRALALTMAAKALNVTLGGPGSVYETSWVGSGSAKAAPYDIYRALYLFGLLHLLLFILLGLLL